MKVKIDIDEYIEWRFGIVGENEKNNLLLNIFIYGGWEGIEKEYKTLADLEDEHGYLPKKLIEEGFEDAWELIACENEDESELCLAHEKCDEIGIEWVRENIKLSCYSRDLD